MSLSCPTGACGPALLTASSCLHKVPTHVDGLHVLGAFAAAALVTAARVALLEVCAAGAVPAPGSSQASLFGPISACTDRHALGKGLARVCGCHGPLKQAGAVSFGGCRYRCGRCPPWSCRGASLPERPDTAHLPGLVRCRPAHNGHPLDATRNRFFMQPAMFVRVGNRPDDLAIRRTPKAQATARD